MQLAATRLAALSALILWSSPSAAEDKADVSTTWYQENRNGALGGLTVIHPQAQFGVDLGDHATLGATYSADIVSGATAALYSVDAVSTATLFDDTRHQGAVSFGLSGSRSSLTLTVGTAAERDYLSLSFAGAASIDLPGKNTNLALSYTRNFDEVCDRENSNTTPLERAALTGADNCAKNVLFGEDTPGMTVWRPLDVDTAQATLTQNLSPTVVGQLSLFGQVIQGFQSNPYRRVRVGGIDAQENVPTVRARVAVSARVNKFLPSLNSAIHGSIRGYSDSWGVESLTLEMAYSQYVGEHLLMRFRARAYQQDASVFFKDAFFYDTEGAAGAFFTGDRELAPLRHIMPGAKLSYIAFDDQGGSTWGVFDEIRFNLKADLLFLDELAADPDELNLEGRDNQFMNSGKLLDAITLHISLLARY